jgi:hypothetical protein
VSSHIFKVKKCKKMPPKNPLPSAFGLKALKIEKGKQMI